MLVRLRRDAANIALPAAQMAVLALTVMNGPGRPAVAGAVAMMALSLYGWLRSLRHARLIAQTPTARIASAAQGYNELRGRGKPLDGTPLRSPANGLPVLWYRLVIQRKERNGQWRQIASDESDASFLLDDGSGVCAVDPEGAELLVRRRDVFLDDNGQRRLIQTSLIAGDPLYVLGDFATLGSISGDFDTAAQVRELLAAWKKDQPALLARFDLDGNGELDMREWELARAQAHREVRQQRQEILAAPEAHIVKRPQDRRLYLISDLDPRRLALRYRGWALFHLLVFLGAAASAAWFAQQIAG